jgi:hypothetical protein
MQAGAGQWAVSTSRMAIGALTALLMRL